ncbi:aminopeptidase [Ramlibacter sp.]|uniref:aminopeptidase n=1 Tax=Ramlibacter sp. TaxID=1917967 RepID=UPI002C45EAA6|nr:aminopeptidase [Ramlibacter sp.]HWI84523.1 aminopeptidase [Ramlibacter sp.]
MAGGAIVAGAALLALTGCSNLGYYWQSATGHLSLMAAARPVEDWLGDANAPQRLKTRLALSRRIRSFAVSELKLPDNPSYHRYADLHRPAAVWNVVVAPRYSLTLKTWCFPVTGCVTYRGYYDLAEARDEAAKHAAEGFETSVYPVPAYSTLGLMNWAGGDPLLNTFIHYPEGELARLIFHELAHQIVYVKNDTMFNESFATAVERLGSARWLAAQASPQAREEYAQYDGRRRQFRELALATRKRLEDVYANVPEGEREQSKQATLQDFRDRYATLRASWGGDPARWRGYDQWVAQANNASFGAQAAYDELVPGFETLFEREGRDWARFYDAVRKLAALPKDERHRLLQQHH